mgnify:CR=1 FL=1
MRSVTRITILDDNGEKFFGEGPARLLNGVEAYSVDSTPADCVRFAVFGLKEKYDLVISGINHGYNLGQDIDGYGVHKGA